MNALLAGTATAVLAYLLVDAFDELIRRRRIGRLVTGRSAGRRWTLPGFGAVRETLFQGELPLRAIQASLLLTVALFAAGLALRAFAIVTIAVFVAIVGLYVWGQRRRWALGVRIDRQLPDAMDVMANALAAGATLFRALEIAAAETPPPLGRLLAAAVARCRINQTVEESLRELRNESASADVEALVAALAIQRTAGGNLAKLLREAAEFMRQEQRLRADARSLSAQARYSAQMIGAMPLALFLLFYAFFPSYVEPLTTTSTGLAVLGYCGISVAFGFYVISRIATRIEHG